MPLPADGTTWPPAEWAPAYRTMRINDAWYSGDKRRLTHAQDAHQPQQARRRWSLWGRKPHIEPRQDNRLHLPLAADIARTSASMLFADMPAITVPDARTQDRLTELIDEARIKQTLLAAAEQGAAMSGIYLRVTWDKVVVKDRPIVSVMQPDRAAPEFAYGMLRAVTFWRDLSLPGAGTVWRHLERHEPGKIVHALFKGTATNLGKRQPLNAHPDTQSLADSIGPDGESIATGTDLLTAVYVPNMLPNRLDRASPIGRSDYDNTYDLLDALDTTWTSWMRDIRLARMRLIVPKGYLQNRGPGAGAEFDDDAEIYEALNIPPTEAGAGITANQFVIRVAEHQSTCEWTVRQTVETAGYDAQAFGMDGGGQPITATEVDARTSRSLTTRSNKIGYCQPELAALTQVLLAVDRAQFGKPNTDERPTVEFPDGVSESALNIATTVEMLNRAGAISVETKVRMVHPEWEESDIKAEVARILAETGMAVSDPTTIGADLPPDPPADDAPEDEADPEQVPEFAAGG